MGIFNLNVVFVSKVLKHVHFDLVVVGYNQRRRIVMEIDVVDSVCPVGAPPRDNGLVLKSSLDIFRSKVLVLHVSNLNQTSPVLYKLIQRLNIEIDPVCVYISGRLEPRPHVQTMLLNRFLLLGHKELRHSSNLLQLHVPQRFLDD
jgi:hypothetical protein